MAKIVESLRNTVINFLLKRGIAVTPGTDPARVKELIRSLRPVTTDKPLVRMGPASDGGYLIPDDLEGIGACFSPGVSTVAGFEKDCADRGIEVFLADKSIDKLPESHARFHFLKKFIGSTNDDDFITPDKWVDRELQDKACDLILQMDIEGFEYETLFSMSEELQKRFRIIVIEFHWNHMLWSKPFFDVCRRSFVKLLQTHSVVHIHPNNIGKTVIRNGIEIPELIEITFFRNDRIRSREYTASFPHPLDVKNIDSAPLILPAFWYKD